MPLKRHDFCWIDAELKDYEKNKKKLEEQYKNFAYMKKGGDIDLRVSGGRISDPTAHAALALYTSREIQHLEWLVDGIGTAMEEWEDNSLLLYDMHYKNKKSPEYVMDTLYWSARKYYYVRRRIIESVAKELGIRFVK